MSSLESFPRTWVRDVLGALGKQHLAFLIFEAALPRAAPWDVGVGTVHGRSGVELLDFLHRLGFDGLQLGPRGAISESNPSPYDATTFSINPLFLDIEALCHTGEDLPTLLTEMQARPVLHDTPPGSSGRTSYMSAFTAQRRLTYELSRRARAVVNRSNGHASEKFAAELAAFRQRHAHWLIADALYEPLCAHHRHGDFRGWQSHSSSPQAALGDETLWRFCSPTPQEANACDALLGMQLAPFASERLASLRQRFEGEIFDYALVQYLLYRQEAELRRQAHARGIEVYGDLAIGYSRRDHWHFDGAFLPGYLLGAPPSRTNPHGQPWGYPVLDPAQYLPQSTPPGLAARLLSARSQNYFARFDRVRIDHPHGIVCPWVYIANTGNDLAAVQQGARLFSTPDSVTHAALSHYSLVSDEQIDRTLPRHADGAVTHLTDEQLTAFARAFDLVIQPATEDPSRLICEVLSTQPLELGMVLATHGLGRFRVTQKANPEDASDVYRTENARPEDWVLLGNHDTPSIWQCIERWKKEGSVAKQASYLAARLSTSDDHRRALERRFLHSDVELAHAKLAELFVCDARNVLVAFTDLFCLPEPYNLPGVICDDNWSLRLPHSYREDYLAAANTQRALSLPKALLLAAQKRLTGSPLLARSAAASADAPTS